MPEPVAALTDIKTLLADLQGLVKYLRTDLLERAIEVSEVDRGLREAYAATKKAERTAQAFEDWRDDYLEQVAVAWVLACVFVRYMEDNDLIAETLAGRHGRPPPPGRGRARGLLPRAPARQRPRVPARRLPQRSARSRRPATCSPRARRRSGPSAPRAMAPRGCWRSGGRSTPRRRACGVPSSRGGRHPVPGRPVPGPLRGGPQEVRAAADAGVRRGVHPRPHADAGPRRVRPGGGAADRPDLRLGPLPARGVPAGCSELWTEREPATEPAVLAQRALDAVCRGGHQPVRRGDRAVPADRRGAARVRRAAAGQGPRLDGPPRRRRQPAVTATA